MSTLTDGLEVSSDLLDEIFSRLNERRVVIEREVLRYGEAPSGIKEVFELCRGFERAYMTSVNESAVAGKVKEAFLGEKGLAGVVRTLPLEKIFELTNVKTVCRYADGYQPHLVSPDKGVHAMSMEALDKVTGPVQNCVQAVHTLLVNAAREAAEKAGEHTEAALVGTSLPMYVPEFKTVIMPAITAALDEWKSDAEKMAMMLVDMERSYITAGFFRFVMTNRSDKIQMHEMQGQQGQQAGQGQKAGQGSQGQPRQGGGSEPKADAGSKSYFPAFGSNKEQDPAARPPPQQQRGPAPEAPEESPGSKASLGSMSNNPNDFVAAYFEKSGSDSGFTPALSALRWQRRFFIFSDTQKTLYYFKSPEDVPKPNGLRGQINVGECFIDDLDDRGQPRHPGSPPVNVADKAHWLLRIRHKDVRQSVVKEHKSVVLKAESYQAKVEWLARLRKATGEVKPKLERPSVKPAPGEQPGQGDPSEPPADGPQGGPPPPPPKGPNDLSWAQDAEPVLDTHLGQGASAFRGDAIREPDGRLPIAPRVLLNPIRLQDQVAGTVPSFEVQYDALLSQIGGDCNMYIRMVCDTICTTVPKAVVHCLIRKSEKNLLERLFTVIHKLTPEQMEQLLKEEEQVVERRKQARKVFEDVKSAVFQVQQNLERRNMTAQAERPDKVVLQANVFAYAGMPDELSTEQRAYFDKLFSDPVSPESMRFWATLQSSRPPPPPPPSAPADAPPSPSQPPPQQQPGARPQGPPPPRGPPPGPPQQQQQQGYPQGPPGVNYRVGPPPPGQLGAALGPLHSGPRPGAPPPPVPMRPAPGMVPPPGRRPPPPPPGAR